MENRQSRKRDRELWNFLTREKAPASIEYIRVRNGLTRITNECRENKMLRIFQLATTMKSYDRTLSPVFFFQLLISPKFRRKNDNKKTLPCAPHGKRKLLHRSRALLAGRGKFLRALSTFPSSTIARLVNSPRQNNKKKKKEKKKKEKRKKAYRREKKGREKKKNSRGSRKSRKRHETKKGRIRGLKKKRVTGSVCLNGPVISADGKTKHANLLRSGYVYVCSCL